jgi:hypothetical protein
MPTSDYSRQLTICDRIRVRMDSNFGVVDFLSYKLCLSVCGRSYLR